VSDANRPGLSEQQALARAQQGNSWSSYPVIFAGLSGHEQKYDGVRCSPFGWWRGARKEHPPQWGCDRGATKPPAKWGATQRAAVLFGESVVARSLQIHWGICAPACRRLGAGRSLAPSLRQKSLAANVIIFLLMTTQPREFPNISSLVSNPSFGGATLPA
jgi:hypothetical protein